jgi:aminoglycoside phosphotransferase (APT) family kinase protein
MKLNKYKVEQICKKLNENLIRFSFLARGNHNSNYLLETIKNKYVIRVEDNQQFKNLKKEFEFFKIAKSGLGPKVILFDASHKIISNDYLIEEFIDGKHPSERNPTDDFIVQMARWLKKLHKTTKKSSKPYLLRTKIKPYYKNYLKYKDNIKDKELKEKLSYYISKALKILEKNNTIFANRKTISLLHNDTSSGNIFFKPGYVCLIDWEFVNYGLPERELVYFLDSYRLTKYQQSLFLRSYGYPSTKKVNTQLSMAYIILLFSSIGYSLWQLDILHKNKSSKKDKIERITRLIRDISLLEEKINKL